MSHNFDARALALAMLVGAHMATAIFIISIVGAFPRVWPGTIGSFVMTTCSTYLLLTSRRRR